MDAEDSELVVRSKGGGLNAFNFIVQRYQSQVLNLSARIIGDRGRAKDVTQQNFTRHTAPLAGSEAAACVPGLCELPPMPAEIPFAGLDNDRSSRWMSLSKARRSSPRPPKPPRRNTPSAAS